MYLQLDPSSPPPEATPELVGVVAKCPTEKNGQQYTIRWKYPRLHGLQWPANLKNHLKTTFDKDFLHPGLKGWITSCPLNSTDHNPAGTIAAQQQATTTPLARRPNHANDPPPPPLPEINVLVAENTPAPSQRMAFAAVHTAGSTSLYSAGAISSLGHSNRSRYTRTLEGTILAIDEQDITSPPVPVAATPPPPLPPMTSRTTRTRANTRTVGAASQRARAAGRYDSDDDNTDGEAEYQMDPHDGFWNPSIEEENILRLLRTQELNLFEDDDDGLSTTEDNPVFGTSTVRPAVSDLGTLIQNCTDFQFEELGMDALAAETLLTPPQPLYVGESGLRRGVAGSFSTPLEAFRKAGFVCPARRAPPPGPGSSRHSW